MRLKAFKAALAGAGVLAVCLGARVSSAGAQVTTEEAMQRLREKAAARQASQSAPTQPAATAAVAEKTPETPAAELSEVQIVRGALADVRQKNEALKAEVASLKAENESLKHQLLAAKAAAARGPSAPSGIGANTIFSDAEGGGPKKR